MKFSGHLSHYRVAYSSSPLPDNSDKSNSCWSDIPNTPTSFCNVDNRTSTSPFSIFINWWCSMKAFKAHFLMLRPLSVRNLVICLPSKILRGSGTPFFIRKDQTCYKNYWYIILNHLWIKFSLIFCFKETSSKEQVAAAASHNGSEKPLCNAA